MGNYMDLTGQRYGSLVVLEYAGRNVTGRPLWKCQCDCGNIHYSSTLDLRSGSTTSCGCTKKERIGALNKTHGYSKERLYNKWKSMKGRCNRPNSQGYKHYGGRGIKVCKEWENDYTKFREWSYANGYKETAGRYELTLDRIDTNGNYEPSNCRWVDMTTQVRNRSITRKANFRGEELTIRELADRYHVSYYCLYDRIMKEHKNAEFAVYELLAK